MEQIALQESCLCTHSSSLLSPDPPNNDTVCVKIPTHNGSGTQSLGANHKFQKRKCRAINACDPPSSQSLEPEQLQPLLDYFH